MKKLSSVFWMLALFSVNASADQLSDEVLQIPIPLISGEQTSLATHKGKKGVYIKFWASW